MKDRSAWELAHVPMETAPAEEAEGAATGGELQSPVLMSA
jgi:hypothetical protein